MLVIPAVSAVELFGPCQRRTTSGLRPSFFSRSANSTLGGFRFKIFYREERMKTLFLLAVLCGSFAGFISTGWAEPYRSKGFPPDTVLSRYFKIKEFTVIGKTRIAEDSYKIYFRIKTGPAVYTGHPILGSAIIRKLDNDTWIGEDVVTGIQAEILQQ